VAPNVIFFVAALSVLLIATSASAQTSRPAHDPLSGLPSYGEMLRRTFYALLAIIGCLVLAAKILPRWLNKGRVFPKSKLIEVVEFHRLEPRKGVYLLRVAGQYYLVASTDNRLETLAGAPLDQQKLDDALRPEGSADPSSPALKPEATTKPNLPFIEVLRGKREQ
jgi:flagellar biogenesis protein FliO